MSRRTKESLEPASMEERGKKDSRTQQCQTAKGRKQKARAKGKYLKAKVCSRLRVVILVAMMGRVQDVLGQGRRLSAATVEAAGDGSGCHVKCSSSSRCCVGDGDGDDGLIDESCRDGQVLSVEPRRVRITEEDFGCSWAASGRNGCRRSRGRRMGAWRLIWKSWHGHSLCHALVAGRVHASSWRRAGGSAGGRVGSDRFGVRGVTGQSEVLD
jgi:hypothetical protein